MATLTIPEALVKRGDLVLIPRSDYEALLRVAKGKGGKDWLYQEPFASELQRRIKVSKKELKTQKVIPWKGSAR